MSIFNVLVQLLLEILARSQPLRLVAMQLEIVEEVGDVPVQLLRLRRRQVGARGEGHELAQDARLLGCLDGSARHLLDPSRVATWCLDFGLGLPAIIGERWVAMKTLLQARFDASQREAPHLAVGIDVLHTAFGEPQRPVDRRRPPTARRVGHRLLFAKGASGHRDAGQRKRGILALSQILLRQTLVLGSGLLSFLLRVPEGVVFKEPKAALWRGRGRRLPRSSTGPRGEIPLCAAIRAAGRVVTFAAAPAHAAPGRH